MRWVRLSSFLKLILQQQTRTQLLFNHFRVKSVVLSSCVCSFFGPSAWAQFSPPALSPVHQQFVSQHLLWEMYTGRGQFGYVLALYTFQWALWFFLLICQNVTTKSRQIFSCLISCCIRRPSMFLLFDSFLTQVAAVSFPADCSKIFSFYSRVKFFMWTLTNLTCSLHVSMCAWIWDSILEPYQATTDIMRPWLEGKQEGWLVKSRHIHVGFPR